MDQREERKYPSHRLRRRLTEAARANSSAFRHSMSYNRYSKTESTTTATRQQVLPEIRSHFRCHRVKVAVIISSSSAYTSAAAIYHRMASHQAISVQGDSSYLCVKLRVILSLTSIDLEDGTHRKIGGDTHAPYGSRRATSQHRPGKTVPPILPPMRPKPAIPIKYCRHASPVHQRHRWVDRPIHARLRAAYPSRYDSSLPGTIARRWKSKNTTDVKLLVAENRWCHCPRTWEAKATIVKTDASKTSSQSALWRQSLVRERRRSESRLVNRTINLGSNCDFIVEKGPHKSAADSEHNPTVYSTKLSNRENPLIMLAICTCSTLEM